MGDKELRLPMRALLLMDPALTAFVFEEREQSRLASHVDIDFSAASSTLDAVAGTQDVEILVTGWGAPQLDEAALARFPRLRAIVHWGGGVSFVDKSAAERGIVVSSARAANAIPVAEFTVAMITLAAKDVFWASRIYSAEQRFVDREKELGHTGLPGTAVGVIGASTIGELVIAELRRRNVTTLVYDPTLSIERAAALGVELCSDLVALASRVKVLSIHAPDIPQTRGMVSKEVLAAMPDGATLVNTARGAIVDQASLLAELTSERLRAVLDVTEPDVLPPGHPLYSLPNVYLTPHLAGSMGSELRRLGTAAVDEVERFVAGQAFSHPAPL